MDAEDAGEHAESGMINSSTRHWFLIFYHIHYLFEKCLSQLLGLRRCSGSYCLKTQCWQCLKTQCWQFLKAQWLFTQNPTIQLGRDKRLQYQSFPNNQDGRIYDAKTAKMYYVSCFIFRSSKSNNKIAKHIFLYINYKGFMFTSCRY